MQTVAGQVPDFGQSEAASSAGLQWCAQWQMANTSKLLLLLLQKGKKTDALICAGHEGIATAVEAEAKHELDAAAVPDMGHNFAVAVAAAATNVECSYACAAAAAVANSWALVASCGSCCGGCRWSWLDWEASN